MLDRIKKIPFRKILRISFWSIVSIIVVLNLIILISGKFHLYKAIWNTILKGRMMPSIHEENIFYNNTLTTEKAIPWPTHCDYSGNRLRDVDKERFESIDTESFLIVYNDSLFYERYWDTHREHNADSISNSFSVAKSVVSMLIGIAIQEGHINSLDDPVGKYLSDFSKGKRASLTIRNLLTMSSGLNWNESSSPFSDNTEGYYGWDLKALINKQDVVTSPGERFNYQSGNSQIAAFVLESATGVTLSEYAEQKLWHPLNATHYALWNLDDENGNEKAFCCLYATARDFARLGQVMLRDGRWHDKQVVPGWYVHASIEPADLITENGGKNTKYGLSWWLSDYRGVGFFYARGILGQYIVVVPSYDLVIVRTGYERAEKLPSDHPQDVYWYVEAALEMI